MRSHFCLALSLVCAVSVAAADDELPPITVLYDPVYIKPDGDIAGPIASPAQRVFAASGLTLTWTPVPSSRSLGMIRANSQPACSPGWYNTPERAAYARFTRPIHIDKALLGLVRADYPVPDQMDSRDLLGRAKLRLGIKQGFSYGPYFDAEIARLPAARVTAVSGGVPAIVKMVHGRHLDMTIVMDEEAESFVAQAGLGMADFRLIRFPDAPKNIGSAIMCSLKVPPEAVERLDAQIEALLETK